MATLGQQLAKKREQQQQGRVTRTQRVQQQQRVERAKQTYIQEKAQADVLAEGLWKDVEYQDTEQYVAEYRPSKFTAQEWDRMRQREKDYYIKEMNSGYGIEVNMRKGRVVVHSYGTRPVTKTRPFTNDDYGNFVENLPENLKKFFVTKEQLIQQQTDWRGEQKTTALTQLQKYQQEQADKIARIQQQIDDKKAWWQRQSSDYRNRENSKGEKVNRINYQEYLSDKEDEMEEKQAYYRGIIEKLQWGAGELDAGKMFSFESIQEHARDYGNYLEDRERARNEAREYNQSQLAKGNIPVYAGEKNKTITGWIKADDFSKYPDYLKNQKVLSKGDISYYQGLQKWSAKAGFDKISPFAQKILNPSAVEWQQKYPNEVLKFDNTGNVIAVSSAQFGGTFDIAGYDTQVKNAQAEYDKQTQMQEDARTYLQEQGFARDVNLEKPKDSWLQNTWSGVKTLWASNLISGWGAKFSESITERRAEDREDRTTKAVLGEFTDVRVPIYEKTTGIYNATTGQFETQKSYTRKDWSLPLYKFGSNSLKDTWADVEAQEGLDYKAKKGGQLFQQLENLSGQVSPEMKDYVLQEGMYMIRDAGIKIDEQTKTETIAGIPTTTTSLIVTDPAFERKLSINMLEWEREREKAGIQTINVSTPLYLKETGIFNAETGKFESGRTLDYSYEYSPMTLKKGFLATRIVSSKALETYGIMKGVQFAVGGVVKGAKWGYDALGGGLKIDALSKTGTFTGNAWVSSSRSVIPKFLTEKTIYLSSGTATVPRTYGTLKTGATIGLAGLYGGSKYLQYQSYKKTSPYGAEVFWLETAGELGGIEMATGIFSKSYNKAMNRIKNWEIKTRSQADISNQGFWRENKRLGFDEKVYMERARPLKLSDRGSWNWRGFTQKLTGKQAGQFTGRSYKYIPDEVMAYYKYGGDVSVYDKSGKLVSYYRTPTTQELIRGGKIANARTGITEVKVNLVKDTKKADPKLIKQLKAEAFPFDDASTHQRWFARRNIQEYGVGNYKDLGIDLSGKSFGYSATGQEWKGKIFDADDLFYVDKGGIVKTLKLKGAVQYYSGKGVSAGFLRVFTKTARESAVGKSATDPIIYGGYFDNVQVNKAIKEVKGFTGSGRELKAYIYSKQTSVNQLNLPLMKKEVEGTVEIATRIPIRRAYGIKLEGWKVPIEEQIFGAKADLSPATLKAIIKNMGGITEVTGTQVSSLPSRVSNIFSSPSYAVSTFSSPAYSFSSTASRTSAKSSTVSEIISKISKISNFSSPQSRASSFSSSISPSSSNVMSDFGYSSSTSQTPSSSYFRTPILALFKAQKSKAKGKRKVTPEIEGLFPDFTSRAIGLAPIKVGGVEGAMREIKRLQSGFEVRRGARIDINFMGNNKGKSDLNVNFFGNGKKGKRGMSEKQLMRSVMA